MQGTTNESVGENFSVDRLQIARDKTLAVILELADLVRPGMTEADARKFAHEIQTRHGAPKSWHPPQIRFGVNTLLPFGKKGEDGTALKEDDIFFFDIGPIFDGHEGDVGRPFAIGRDQEMQGCCRDAEAIWHDVRDHWKKTGAKGNELYKFAQNVASDRGWILTLDSANGHRIADFPHAAKMRGSIEGFAQNPAPNRWILEIQIRHPSREFGAFYEDLLN